MTTWNGNAGEEGNSVAAGVREVDGADERDRHQQNDGSKKNEDDQNSLLKFGKEKCKLDAKGTSCIINELKHEGCARKLPKGDSCGQQFTAVEYWD